MYSKVLRALSLLLALIMLSAVVISCDNIPINENTKTEATSTPSDAETEDTDPADRATEGTDKETEKGTEKETGKETEKETDKETDKETEKETDKETDEETEKETDKETNKETDKETNKETDKETEKETEKEPGGSDEETFIPVVPTPDFDFEGENINILVRNHTLSSREWYKETAEDELDEAVAMRNTAVETSLNLYVTYELVPYENYNFFADIFNSIIVDDIVSDLHYYDIAANFASSGAYPVVRDCAANLNDKETFPYFDFSLPCWNQSIVNNTTINDRLHYVSGDLNLSMFDAAMIIWYNKDLYDLKKEPTDHDNIQDLAIAGNWTYQDLYVWASRLYKDSNGTVGREADDTYALSIAHSNRSTPNPHDAIPYAWDLDFVITNNDGTHSFNFIQNKKAEEALLKFRALIDAHGTYQNGGVDNFAAGHYIFWTGAIYPSEDTNITIREMEDIYGILPWPKYDINQEKYGTTVQDCYTLMTALNHAESSIPTKGKAVSAYLQLATEVSYTNVRGYYFNRIIKPKFFGTDDSEGTVTKSFALFEIIVDNIELDFWTVYSPQLNDVAWLWRSAVSDTKSLEQLYLDEEERYQTAIEDVDIWLGLRSLG